MKKRIFIAMATILVVSTGIYLSQHSKNTNCPSFNQRAIQINDQVFEVGVAWSSEAKTKGLSGCPHLPSSSGLVFPFPPHSTPVFWMKDMLIPIDIIWISDNTIVGINANIPPPAPNTADDQLTRYPAPAPVDTVLEVAAGTTQQENIKVGDTVNIWFGANDPAI